VKKHVGETTSPPEFNTVWTRQPRPPRGPTRRDRVRALSRDEIVRAAIEIADDEGPEAVSMRRIAQRLRVGTMSLYWHVANKDELIDLIGDAIIGEVEMPDPSSLDWRANLRQIAVQTRALGRRHPWLATIIGARPALGPNMLRHIELSLAAIEGTGLDVDTMLGVIHTVDNYAMGFTLDELREEETRRRTGLTEEQWRRAIMPYVQEVMAGGKYPRFNRIVVESTTDHDDKDKQFAFGLECVLDGIAAQIAKREHSGREGSEEATQRLE
jgi:AcrR family transcriptional regulator